MQVALKSPSIQKFLFKLYLQLHHRKTSGLAGSSSEHEVEHPKKGMGVEAEDEWWTTSLAKKTEERQVDNRMRVH